MKPFTIWTAGPLRRVRYKENQFPDSYKTLFYSTSNCKRKGREEYVLSFHNEKNQRQFYRADKWSCYFHDSYDFSTTNGHYRIK